MLRRSVVIGMVGLLAACGSSSSSASAGQPYVDAAMKSYDNGSSQTKDGFTRPQAKCAITAMVDAVGADTLREKGITPRDFGSKDGPFKGAGAKLSSVQAEKIAGVLTDGKCFNFVDLVMKQAGSSSSTFGKLPKAKVRCFFEKVLAKAEVKKAIAGSLVGGTSSKTSTAVSSALGNSSATFKIFSDCGISPSALGS